MQKNKFNIGDKVRVARSAKELKERIGYIAGDYIPELELSIGKVFTVKNIAVFGDRIGYCEGVFSTPIFDEDLLELYDEEKMKFDKEVAARVKEALQTLIKEVFEGYAEKKDQE